MLTTGWRALTSIGLFLLISIVPIVALANGGPVDWTEGTPRGGLAPKLQSEIRLMTEDLSIRLEDDLDHYRVAAVYWLSNPGKPTKVKFGLPMQWGGKRTPSIVAEDISIEVAGQKSSCAPANVTATTAEQDDETGETRVHGSAWCVAEVSIPSGSEVALKLNYRGEMQFEDILYSKSAFKEFGDRVLDYPLFPAGYWRGKVERVSIRIALGPYRAENIGNVPTGAKLTDSSLELELRNIDLKHALDFKIELNGDTLLHAKEIATWNAGSSVYTKVATSVRASSTLGPQQVATSSSFEAANLIDGSRATAWCAGGANGGVGEWVEVRFNPPTPDVPECMLEAIGVIPGYARNEFDALGASDTAKKCLRFTID